MRPVWPDYLPVTGKTYSLFGDSVSTCEYYDTIKMLADKIIGMIPDIGQIVEYLVHYSSKSRAIRRVFGNQSDYAAMTEFVNFIGIHLGKYTVNAEEHLRKLPVSKLWDHRIATSREQYHLYMLEIELTNRQFATGFTRADKKIALLPYCLQDFSVNCKSEKNGFDFQCRHCSRVCFQNHASIIFKTHLIEPYIWTEGT